MSLTLTEDIESKYSIPIYMTLVSKDEFSQAIDSAYPLMLEIWYAKKIEKGFWKIHGLAVIESG